MSSVHDPFGYETPEPGFSPRPITIIAHPGQEIRILVADESGALPQAMADKAASPSRSPDKAASPSRSPDRLV